MGYYSSSPPKKTEQIEHSFVVSQFGRCIVSWRITRGKRLMGEFSMDITKAEALKFIEAGKLPFIRPEDL